MAEPRKGRLRNRKEELMEEHHKRRFGPLATHKRYGGTILDCGAEDTTKAELHFKEEFEPLKTIPPVKDSASGIIAEMGVNMDLFPTAARLSSWAGMTPA